MNIQDRVRLWRLRRRAKRLRRDCDEAVKESLRLNTEETFAKSQLLENERLRLDEEVRQMTYEKLCDDADRWGVDYFNSELNQFEIRNRITVNRRTYYKDWAQTIIPILSLIVAILALFRDIIIEILKKKF